MQHSCKAALRHCGINTVRGRSICSASAKKRLVYQFADNNALMTWLHYGAGINECHHASLNKMVLSGDISAL